MSPLILLIMVIALTSGTIITLMSSHWLLAWMGLEINTLAIIPIMIQHHHPRAVEATTKYFLIQATAATTLLFASTMNAWMTGLWEISQNTYPLSLTIITIALALKMGLAPMHSWLPDIMQGLSFYAGLILATWQKLAPFSLLLQSNNSSMTIFLGLLSVMVGGWGGLNQTQLRKILAYSSIAHLGWMLIVMQISPSLSLMTLITYIIMTFSLFNIFIMNNTTNINSLSTCWMKMPLLSTLTPLVLLSLGGLPPLTGFMPKWLILQELVKQDLVLMATVAALFTLLSLFFYLRLSYALALTIAPNTSSNTMPWRLVNKNMKMPTAITTMMTLLMLPLLPMLLAITI
uniref:NADH-ubiquinone oxidoreductase chain 2 n=1 Tax=Nothobranchius thierryi TaxID=60304 RepID=A0A518LY70_9TELE|nr:NADH dehydrogenase subunit 2 [Nothobranchius thierryi]QDW10528.1 NADH dehydrogenase subunit 2 [Nothobranchius thierryi]